VEEIEIAGQRAAELARQMLAYSGKGRFVVQNIDLNMLVEEMAHLLRASIAKGARLDYDFQPGLPAVEVDTTQLRQVVMNLVINASDAIGEGRGEIAIKTGVVDVDRQYLAAMYLAPDIPEGQYVFLEVSDTGSGMDAETLARIFDPFFTTKFTGRGLGLAAVLGIVRGHRGALRVSSEPGKGTTFLILLPPAAEAVRGPDAPTPIRARWRSSGTVLLIDDEETVRTVTTKALELFGFTVLAAPGGEEGVALFSEHADEIVGVLLDLTMPRMSGDVVFDQIRAIRPDARVILMSGYSEQEAFGRFTGEGLAGFVQKPYDVETLRKALRAIVEND
jgi:CheY-like chemotaxis protein